MNILARVRGAWGHTNLMWREWLDELSLSCQLARLDVDDGEDDVTSRRYSLASSERM